MTWTATKTWVTGEIVSAAEFNQLVGTGGNIDHLHVGTHLSFEELTNSGTNEWQASATIAKVLAVWWRGVCAMPSEFTVATDKITFLAAFLDANNSSNGSGDPGTGDNLAAGDKVWALIIKVE